MSRCFATISRFVVPCSSCMLLSFFQTDYSQVLVHSEGVNSRLAIGTYRQYLDCDILPITSSSFSFHNICFAFRLASLCLVLAFTNVQRLPSGCYPVVRRTISTASGLFPAVPTAIKSAQTNSMDFLSL